MPKKAGAKTTFLAEAFIACMAAIATEGSAASRPHIVEQTQAWKKPKIAPLARSESKAEGRSSRRIVTLLKHNSVYA